MPKQPHHHLERSLNAYSDERVWTHPQLLQMASQLVGALIELAIAQLLVFEHDRHGLGRALDLLLKKLMQAPVLGIGNLRPVPLHEHLLRSASVSRGNSDSRAVRIGSRGLEHRVEMPEHALDASFIE